jgi:hypothetical protein
MAAQPRKEKNSGRVLKREKEEQKGNHSRISAYRPRTDLTVRASLGLTLHTSAAEEGKSTHKKERAKKPLTTMVRPFSIRVLDSSQRDLLAFCRRVLDLPALLFGELFASLVTSQKSSVSQLSRFA